MSLSLREKQWKAFKRHKPGLVGLFLIAGLIIIALFANLISPVDPFIQDMNQKFMPPIWMPGGSWPNIFGTDVLGRDLFSRIVFGARLSLFIGSLAVATGAFLGVPLGMVSGYFGGKIDATIMRAVDLMLAFPSLLLAVCIVAILGASLQNAVISIGIVTIPTYARVARASVMAEKEREYVLADIALGRTNMAIIMKAIFPNILSPLLVVATLGFGGAVLDAAGLSFLGLGAQPPSPEWGALVTEGKNYIFQAWWLIFFPGFAILLTVVGFNLFGDALRDIFDPRSVGKR
jgi:ABC-type dipeptide/oligopeptide/nickel transport system permease subunit